MDLICCRQGLQITYPFPKTSAQHFSMLVGPFSLFYVGQGNKTNVLMKVPKMLGQFEYKATSSYTFSCQDIDDESASRTRGHWLQQWMLSATIAQTNATKPENIYMIEMPALFGKHYRVAMSFAQYKEATRLDFWLDKEQSPL